MKSIILSSSNNIDINQLLSFPNYSLDGIFIKTDYIVNYKEGSIYDFILKVSNKLAVKGLLTIDILDTKLLCQHHLASLIDEEKFASI
jgi:hypothetical protein